MGDMRTLLALVLVAACSGTAGGRDRSEALVVATHCQGHACKTTPQARGLGEGCYVVDDELYQCSTDVLPVGEASCFAIPRCAGACKVTITVDDREISTERCRARWAADRAAHRPPPRCSPVRLQVLSGPAVSPADLRLPAELVLEVLRTGKSRLMYEAEACSTNDGVVVGEATHTTGFAGLDGVLRGEVAALAPPPGECVTIVLLASEFECDLEVELM
jgi:hypothetical protein